MRKVVLNRQEFPQLLNSVGIAHHAHFCPCIFAGLLTKTGNIRYKSVVHGSQGRLAQIG